MTAMTRPYLAANCKLKKNSMEKIIINVGRQFGSGGKLIAQELGKRLGISVYDSELITKAAQDSGFSQELFRNSDEKRRFLSFNTIYSGFTGNTETYISDNGLFKIQSATIRNIADSGPAIIVGRCSDYILRDLGCTLDVFITAPLENRKDRVAERLGTTREKAEEMILKQDKKRESYYNYFTFGNWGVASNYDLCIDSSILGIEGTAEFIINFAKKAGLLG